MDLVGLYELTQHFAAAAAHIPDIVHTVSDKLSNIWTALTAHGAMTPSERVLHIGKLAGTTIGLVFCAATLSFEGIVGFAIPEGEEIYALNKIGKNWRASHPAHETGALALAA